MTLRQAIAQAHCRRGKANGTTNQGAYWIHDATNIVIRSFGSDGVGSNSPDFTNKLELRHYRDGAVRARVHVHAWHQNGAYSGSGDWYANADAILDCETAEAVIVALKGARDACDRPVYSDIFEVETYDALATVGIPASDPAPDETVAQPEPLEDGQQNGARNTGDARCSQ